MIHMADGAHIDVRLVAVVHLGVPPLGEEGGDSQDR
jgi:hypothetical protein